MGQKRFHIHEIFNQIDEFFGYKHRSIKVTGVDSGHIYLKVLYRINVKITEENKWPNSIENKVGSRESQSIMCRLWITEKHKEFPWEEVPLQSILWKDNIYINEFCMSDYSMAKKFYEAMKEWTTCRADYHFSSYQDVILPEKVVKDIKTTAAERVKDYAEAAQAFFGERQKTHWLLTLSDDEPRDRFQYFRRKLQGFSQASEYAYFMSDSMLPQKEETAENAEVKSEVTA